MAAFLFQIPSLYDLANIPRGMSCPRFCEMNRGVMIRIHCNIILLIISEFSHHNSRHCTVSSVVVSFLITTELGYTAAFYDISSINTG